MTPRGVIAWSVKDFFRPESGLRFQIVLHGRDGFRRGRVAFSGLRIRVTGGRP